MKENKKSIVTVTNAVGLVVLLGINLYIFTRIIPPYKMVYYELGGMMSRLTLMFVRISDVIIINFYIIKYLWLYFTAISIIVFLIAFMAKDKLKTAKIYGIISVVFF